MVILAPRKFFLCLQMVKTISSFLHYRNHPLSSSSSLSPPTLEILIHALTKWTARQWRLIYSNKKYKKTREIQAKWPNRATTSFRQGSSSSFHRWFSVCIPFSSIPSYGTQTKAFFFQDTLLVETILTCECVFSCVSTTSLTNSIKILRFKGLFMVESALR